MNVRQQVAQAHRLRRSLATVSEALSGTLHINVSEAIAVTMGALLHPALAAGNVTVGVDNMTAVCAMGRRSTKSRGCAAAARACAELLFRSDAVRTGVTRIRPAWVASAANPRADAVSRRMPHPDVDTLILVHPALAVLILAAGTGHREASRRMRNAALSAQIGTWHRVTTVATPERGHGPAAGGGCRDVDQSPRSV